MDVERLPPLGLLGKPTAAAPTPVPAAAAAGVKPTGTEDDEDEEEVEYSCGRVDRDDSGGAWLGTVLRPDKEEAEKGGGTSCEPLMDPRPAVALRVACAVSIFGLLVSRFLGSGFGTRATEDLPAGTVEFGAHAAEGGTRGTTEGAAEEEGPAAKEWETAEEGALSGREEEEDATAAWTVGRAVCVPAVPPCCCLPFFAAASCCSLCLSSNMVVIGLHPAGVSAGGSVRASGRVLACASAGCMRLDRSQQRAAS